MTAELEGFLMTVDELWILLLELASPELQVELAEVYPQRPVLS